MAGHSALLFVTEDGKGYYYSVSPNKTHALGMITRHYVQGGITTSIDQLTKTMQPVNVNSIINEDENTNIIEIENVMGINGKTETHKYDRAIIIPITNEEGWDMISKAEELRTDQSYAYNLYENNCGQVSQEILGAGGKDFAISEWSADDEKETLNRKSTLIYNILKPFIIYSRDKEDYTIPNSAYEEAVRLIELNDESVVGWELIEYNR